MVCPNCRRPIPLAGALGLIAGEIVILSLVAYLIPSETVPRVVEQPGGAVEYCIQSLRRAVLVPVGFLVVLVLGAALPMIFRVKQRPQESPSLTGIAKWCDCLAKWSLWIIYGACFAVVTLLVWAGLLRPLWARYRIVMVTPKTVEFRALLYRCSIPRSQIRTSEIVRHERLVRGKPLVDIEFIVRDQTRHVHRSAKVESLNPAGAELPKYLATLEHLQAQLSGQAPRRPP